MPTPETPAKHTGKKVIVVCLVAALLVLSYVFRAVMVTGGDQRAHPTAQPQTTAAMPLAEPVLVPRAARTTTQAVAEHVTLTFPDGGQFFGTVKDDKPHGYGKATFGNGDRYEGNFYNGTFHGRGTYSFASHALKAFYQGEYQHGQAEGEGTVGFRNGVQWTGQHVEGYPVGVGTWHLADGSTVRGPYNGQGLVAGQAGTPSARQSAGKHAPWTKPGLDERFVDLQVGECRDILVEWIQAEKTVPPIERCDLFATWMVNLYAAENVVEGNCLMTTMRQVDPELEVCLRSKKEDIMRRLKKATTVEVTPGAYVSLRRTPVRELPMRTGRILEWLKHGATVNVVGADRDYYRIASRSGEQSFGYVRMIDFQIVQ